MEIHVVHHVDATTRRQLNEIIALLRSIAKTETNIMTTLKDIEADVADETTVIASVETLVSNIVAAGQAADPAELAALLASIDANKARLAALVVANTKAQPEAPAAPAAVEAPPAPPADPSPQA